MFGKLNSSVSKKTKHLQEAYIRGAYAEVIALYEQILQECPNDFDENGIHKALLKIDDVRFFATIASQSYASPKIWNAVQQHGKSGPLHFMLGRCYYMAEAPYKNASKAVEHYTKAVGSGYSPAKSSLAFCCIFGDGVPVDLPKALDLLKQAYKDAKAVFSLLTQDRTAYFVLNHLVNIKLLLELWRQGKMDDIDYALSDNVRRRTFLAITNDWSNTCETPETHSRAETAEQTLQRAQYNRSDPITARNFRTSGLYGYDETFSYDKKRLRTLLDVWNKVYGPECLRDKDYEYDPTLLEWIRYYHYQKGVSKERIINQINNALFDLGSERLLYETSLSCLCEMSQGDTAIATNISNVCSHRGGLGEPYCSEQCYESGQRYVGSVMLQGQSGVCGFCQKPVRASLYGEQECAAIPFEGMTLFVCIACAEKATAFLKNYQKCCMCQNPCQNPCQESVIALESFNFPVFEYSDGRYFGANQEWAGKVNQESNNAIAWFNAQNFVPIPDLGLGFEAEYCFDMATQARSGGNFQEAWAGFHQALHRYCRLKNDKMIGLSCFNLGTIYFNWQKWDLARLMFSQSVYINKRLGEKEEYAWSVFQLSAVMSILGDDASARMLLTEVLPVFQQVLPESVALVEEAIREIG